MTARDTSTFGHAGPAVPSATGCMRYSSARRPTEAAFTRSGMSLVTSVTSRPSAARLSATARMRESLLSTPEAGRQRGQVGVVQLDVQRAAGVADRHRRVQSAVPDPQLVQRPQRLPGEPAQFGVVALALQLADDDQRQHHVVLGEAAERSGIGQQHRGVEDEGAQRGGVGGLERAAVTCRSSTGSVRTSAGTSARTRQAPGALRRRASPADAARSWIRSVPWQRQRGCPVPLAGTPPLRDLPSGRVVRPPRERYVVPGPTVRRAVRGVRLGPLGLGRELDADEDHRLLLRSGSAAVAALPGAEVAQRPQEVDLAEVRPERVAEVELRVDRLPQQEARQPLLARGADDQIGVGLARRCRGDRRCGRRR